MMTTIDRLVTANAEAQLAFHRMLVLNAQSDPEHPLTKAYVAAERAIDEVLSQMQWEKSQREWDLLTSEDAQDLAAGDHFAGMPR